MAEKREDEAVSITIDAFLRAAKMTEAEFCRQMGYQNRQNARHWRNANYYINYNKGTGSVCLMKPERKFRSFNVKEVSTK
jgi:hypothetical protein